MAKHSIFILGDSTSMTLGADRVMYPFLLADSARWAESTEFVNCSQPGITSADACAFFFLHRPRYRNVRAVIIYLGNCDAVSSEISKGRYTPFLAFRQWVAKLLGRPGKKIRLKNRLLRFEWNQNFDPSIERPEKATDYEYNIGRIINACRRASTPVILVRPKANPLLPPGLGKGNFAFYRYIGLDDTLSSKLTVPDSRFPTAYSLHEEGKLAEAKALYKEILLDLDKMKPSLEYPLIVANNYAAATGESGNLDEADYLFRLLLKESQCRREITLYNLAQVCKRRGDEAGYRNFLAESFQSDQSMYRVRDEYRAAIDRLRERFDGHVQMVDMEQLILVEMFLDHCHPLPQGQRLLAEQVGRILEGLNLVGNEKAEVVNILYNPELALGNLTEFYTYFKTYAPYSEEDIRNHLTNLKQKAAEEVLPPRAEDSLGGLPWELKRGLDYYLSHPCFPTLWDAVRAGPVYPVDTGRFPEFFLYRYLIPFLRIHEKEPPLLDRFADSDVLRTVEQLTQVLPPGARELIDRSDPVLDAEYEAKRLEAILERIRIELLGHLTKGSQVHNRIKAIMYWYFRELLRFGPHARISMLYERIFLEHVAEALALAGVLDLRLGTGREEDICGLVTLLKKTVELHEEHCRRFRLGDDNRALLTEYDCSLRDTAALLAKQGEIN
jgi:hypothetical protein